MANEYLDDFEQAEVVKKWIKENGAAIFLGIALGLAALFGWRYWQGYQADQRVEAAVGYAELLKSLEAGEVGEGALERFEDAYGNAAYTGLAALALAQDAVEADDLEAAAGYLRRAVEVAEPQALRQVAGLRLARVQSALGRHDEALATVDQWATGSFEILGSELRGDILVAKGERDAALEAYRYALNNSEGGGDRNLLQMKIDDLAAADQGDST